LARLLATRRKVAVRRADLFIRSILRKE